MGIQDNALHLGVESTYGTFTAPTRSFEGQGDGWKLEKQYLDSVGFRGGIHTTRSDRRKTHTLGGEGSIELDVMNKGMGMLLAGLLGTESVAQVGATTAYEQEFSTAVEPSDTSYSVQMVRSLVDSSAVETFTHLGAVPTSFSIAQEVDDLLKMEIGYDLRDIVTTEAKAADSYVADQTPFDWADCQVEVDSTEVDMMSFSLEGELAIKTDRRYLRGSSLKKRPRRNAFPTFSGELMADFDSMDRYNEFAAGTTHEVKATWTGEAFDGTNYSLEILLAEVQWEGDSPEASLTELTKQALPFRVLHNGTDPAVKITYVSTDTAA